MNLFNFTTNVQTVTDKEGMNLWFKDLVVHLDVDLYDFTYLVPQSMTTNESLSCTNYPDEWVSEYEREGYSTYTPFNRQCFELTTPFVWDDLKKHIV